MYCRGNASNESLGRGNATKGMLGRGNARIENLGRGNVSGGPIKKAPIQRCAIDVNASTALMWSPPLVPVKPVGAGLNFLVGANTPWKTYGSDFGHNFDSQETQDWWEAHLSKVEASGANCIRIFLLGKGRSFKPNPGIVADNWDRMTDEKNWSDNISTVDVIAPNPQEVFW
eukprot:jgi/Botrbrau1/3874/Bobra.0183s0098.1